MNEAGFLTNFGMDHLMFICNIECERNDEDKIKIYQYNIPIHQRHRHGEGPFCRIKIGNEYQNASGIYFIYSGDELKYIGKTDNLSRRFNKNYGHITQSDVKKGGRSTNCRINNMIYNEIKKKRRLFRCISIHVSTSRGS